MEYVLAALLLMAPADTDKHTPDPAIFESARWPIQFVAVEWQLLDEREMRYVLTRREDFVADLNLLRRRHAELHDAPMVEDSYRFPGRDYINDCMAFNRAYRKHLEVSQPGNQERCQEHQRACQETDHLHFVWDTITPAANTFT